MKKEELSRLQHIKREIERQQYRLAELEAAVTSRACAITGMPKSCGKRDWLAEYAVKIAQLKNEMDINMKKCFFELQSLNRNINSIDDSRLRLILSLRYINGLKWRQISLRLGRKATEDSVRIVHSRFLKEPI